MYSQGKKFIPTILLFGILLQSCRGGNFNIDQPARQQVQADQQQTHKERPKRHQHIPQAPSNHERRQVQPNQQEQVLQEQVLTQTADDTATYSRVHPQAATTTGFTSKAAKKQQQTHNTVPSTSRQAQRICHQPGQCKGQQQPRAVSQPLAHPQQPAPTGSAFISQASSAQHTPPDKTPRYKIPTTPKVSAPCRPLTTATGEQVTFSQQDGQWKATVKEVLGMFSRQQTLSVVGHHEQDLTAALLHLQDKPDAYVQRRIHILETHRPPWAPRAVYVGDMGLKGGMKPAYADSSKQDYFDINVTQIAEDTELVKMSMVHRAFKMMIPEQYEAFCREAYDVFNLLKGPVSPHELTSHLRSLFSKIKHLPILTNAIPLYVATFGQERAEVVGVLLARFLLSTGRLAKHSVSLCRASCNSLLEGIRCIVSEEDIRGHTRSEVEKECDALHIDASREAARQLTEQALAREQAEMEERLAAAQRQREAEQRRQEQEERARRDALRAERERKRAEEDREEPRRQQQQQAASTSWLLPFIPPKEPEVAEVLPPTLTPDQDKENAPQAPSKLMKLPAIVTDGTMPWNDYFLMGNYPEVGINTILYQRHWETNKSTTGPFIITGTSIRGFFLEPPGPSTPVANISRRVPAGVFLLSKNKGEKRGLRLRNNQVPASRAILIHAGNEPKDTEGCLLPGVARGAPGKPDWVAPSSKKLREIIISWFEQVGPQEASMQIVEP